MTYTKDYKSFKKIYDENVFLKYKPEFHLMVFWKRPVDGEDQLLEQISAHFSIKEVFHLHWTPEKIVENFQRFYAMIEGHAYQKFTQSGVLPFLLVVVQDLKPSYEYRVSGGSGYKFVNTKTFDLKQKMRKQKGISLHATNDHREFRRDLMYLLGIKADVYAKKNLGNWDGNIQQIHQDIVGADGWKNLPQVFEVLNEAVDYVVLRNFEELPDEHILGIHADIDFLVQDVDAYHRAASILNKERAAHTQVGDRKIYFDFRSVNDFYYDPKWCRRLLETKVPVRGFYAVNPHDYFFSLLYHGHVHKPKISKDYGERLLPIAKEIGLVNLTSDQLINPASAAIILEQFLKGNGYYLTRPNGCPGFNDNFASRLSSTPFLYQSESNFYTEFLISSNLADGNIAIDQIVKSRKWLLKKLIKRLLAMPFDLLRNRLTQKQKKQLRPLVRKLSNIYASRR